MHTYYLAYILALTVSGAISLALIVRMWGQRSAPGAYGLIGASACVAEWSLAYALEISSTDMDMKIAWAKMQLLGISFVSLGILFFTMHYSRRGKWLTASRLLLILAPSALFFLMTVTNEAHNQIWTQIRFTDNQPFGPLDLTHGILFYVFAAYQYLLLFATTIFLFEMTLHGQSTFRNQSRIMLGGMIFPWLANFLYLTKLNPFPTLDLTPLALTLSDIALSLSFLRYRFLDIQPVAHDSVFNAMQDGVIVLDYKERIVDINPVGTLIFQDTGNFFGREIASLLPKWTEWHTLNQGRELNQELELDIAGEKLTFSLRTTSVIDERGRRNGRVILISDITAQKQAQEKIIEANHMKTRLLASIGHDLRSPLGAIIGYAEMLKEGAFGKVNEDQQKANAEILDSANQLLTFINNFIGQAQIETGKIILRESAFQIEEVVGPLLSTLNFHANKKGLVFTQYTDPALPEQLIGDQFWLRQIVLNLVHNAVKFTESGSVELNFQKRNNDHWAIQVRDTGVGIPAEAQRRVFQAFEQANNVEPDRKSGFGLGLAIVAQLTSLMKGNIELESAEGRGCSFTIVLPLKIAAT